MFCRQTPWWEWIISGLVTISQSFLSRNWGCICYNHYGGNCLAGKIPGSVKKFSPTAVSTLTIANVNSHSLVVPQDEVVSSSCIEDLQEFSHNSTGYKGIELYENELDDLVPHCTNTSVLVALNGVNFSSHLVASNMDSSHADLSVLGHSCTGISDLLISHLNLCANKSSQYSVTKEKFNFIFEENN